ncbi:MAG TPA: NosD domain-containing protein [Mucilaginibacter sp.]
MKTKQLLSIAAAFAVALIISSCSKKENTSVTTPVIPPSHPIAAGNISGFVKGTLLTGATYTVTGDVVVKKGDTLAAQPGAIVIVKNNAQFTIEGVLALAGSQASPVSFNSDKNTPGTWGGFQCDTAQSVTIKWTRIDNTGGLDPSGDPRKSISVAAPINVDVEDSWLSGGEDDIVGVKAGAKVTILRNTFTSNGSTDGECINLKAGVTGVVAYNVIFGQSGTAIKLETSATAPNPQTSVDVYNNTAVSCGWRRGAGEPGRGVSVGVNAKANIYNNIFVNNYEGLEIFPDADVTNTKYGNNLFYASVDAFNDNTVTPAVPVNIRANFFPNDGVGKATATDLISTAIGNNDPKFKTFDGTVVGTATGQGSSNDYHLQSGSPAIGKGNPTYNADMGAYTTDGKGNKH